MMSRIRIRDLESVQELKESQTNAIYGGSMADAPAELSLTIPIMWTHHDLLKPDRLNLLLPSRIQQQKGKAPLQLIRRKWTL